MAAPDASAASPEGSRLPLAAGAGALTMVALCFANGLQGGGGQAFAQSTEALKHTFHINDAALGVVPFCTAIAGNVGAVPIAAICARHRRTTVLGTMFVVWGVLMALAGLTPAFWIYSVLVVVLLVSCAWMLFAPPAQPDTVAPATSGLWAADDADTQVPTWHVARASSYDTTGAGSASPGDHDRDAGDEEAGHEVAGDDQPGRPAPPAG